MHDLTLTTQQRVQARRLARDLRPKARAFLRSPDGKTMLDTIVWNGDMVALAPAMRQNNVEGIHIFQVGTWWFAQMIFKTVPAGAGNAIGTYPLQPSPSRETAVEAATALLSVVLACEQGLVTPAVSPSFLLEGVMVSFEYADLQALEAPPEDLTDDDLREVITTALDERFPEGFSEEGFSRLGEEEKTMLNAAMGYLLRSGVTAFARPGKGKVAG